MLLTGLKKIKRDFVVPWLRTVHVVMTGHTQYEKFIIVCSPRTGSNLLVTYLDFHSNIQCYPEIFKPSEEDRKTAGIYPKSGRLHRIFLTSPEIFLDKHLFAKHYPKEILGVGFKLLYPQSTEGVITDKIKRIYACLSQNKSIKVIHLHRKNQLASCLSRKRVNQSGAWTSHCTLYGDPETALELSYDECIEYFEIIEANKNSVNDMFKDHPKIDVYYEDLVNDKDKELRRILNFLGLAYEGELQTHLKKQNPRPLCESIANYPELKRQFSQTQYAVFFDTEN